MKVIIKFNKKFKSYYKDTENIKRTIDGEDLNKKIKTALDNGKGLIVVNTFGQWVYKIRIKK